MDEPGAWHHVMGRGIAKRTIFESREDYRFFLALLAVEIRRGTIEVHSFALMQTHFHLLVRSPIGRLSRAMERVLRAYSRWFNRRRGRDGALFHERFKSKRIKSDGYRSILVRYIDDNPVKAGMASHAAAFPYGSAFCYAQDRGPVWLERSWIESEVRGVRGRACYAPIDYQERFPSRLPASLAEWIGDRINRRRAREDEFGELMSPHSKSQIDWMVRKALLADGTEPFVLALPPALVEEEWRSLRREDPEWPWDVARERGSAWATLRAGVLRHSCALTFPEMRARSGLPTSTLSDQAQVHRHRLKCAPEYARRTALLIERVQRRIAVEAYPHRYVATDQRP
ncbi:MAG: transposase [Planctomycetota bacterium]|jgi:REP element-mobilizing transposase RayT